MSARWYSACGNVSMSRNEDGLDLADLQPLVVPLISVHEDLQRVNLERICALAWVVCSILPLAGFVQLAQLVRQLAIVFPLQPQPRKLDVGLQPESLVVGALEDVECQGVELLHASVGVCILGRLFDEVEHVVDGLLGVVARDGRLDVGEKLLVVLDGLVYG